jgi:hypothetical protein
MHPLRNNPVILSAIIRAQYYYSVTVAEISLQVSKRIISTMAGIKRSESEHIRWGEGSLGDHRHRARGRPWRSTSKALEVLEFKEQGFSDTEIAGRFGWAKQKDNYEKERLSRTVGRYLKRAREILSPNITTPREITGEH